MATFIAAARLFDLISVVGPPSNLYLRVLNETEVAVGADPLHPSHVVNLSKEVVGVSGESVGVGTAAPREPQSDPTITTRRTGSYWVRVSGRQLDCGSLKRLLFDGLRAIEKTRPGTLEKLSRIKLRSRRIVAREPKQLFDNPQLAQKFAAPLADGWWFGTNNSAAETNAWLERAFACAGLAMGPDNRTNMTISLEDI